MTLHSGPKLKSKGLESEERNAASGELKQPGAKAGVKESQGALASLGTRAQHLESLFNRGIDRWIGGGGGPLSDTATDIMHRGMRDFVHGVEVSIYSAILEAAIAEGFDIPQVKPITALAQAAYDTDQASAFTISNLRKFSVARESCVHAFWLVADRGGAIHLKFFPSAQSMRKGSVTLEVFDGGSTAENIARVSAVTLWSAAQSVKST